MYYLRFYLNNSSHTINVAGVRYDVTVNNESAVVIVYEKMTSDKPGVEFHVGRDFDNCYIVNSEGKTIDRIIPPEYYAQARS